MKYKALLVAVAVAGGLLAAVPAKAAKVVAGNDTADEVATALGIDCDLVLLAKFEWDPKKLGTTDAVWDEGKLGATYWNIVVNADGKSGKWSFNGSTEYDLKALAIKGGNWFEAVDISGQSSGDWDTAGITVGNGNNGNGNQPAVSHLSFYGCKSVPEPASLLAGLLALGLGFAGRRYIA